MPADTPQPDPPTPSPAAASRLDDADPAPASVSRPARIGLSLFALYVLVYAGFVWLSAFRPAVMASTPLGGVNLAILYGCGLIAGAILISLVYMALCSAASDGDSERPAASSAAEAPTPKDAP